VVELIDYSVDGSFIAIGQLAMLQCLRQSQFVANTIGNTCWSRDANDWRNYFVDST
jgi:hypothetical protein